MDISVSCSWSGHLDNFLFHISLNSLNCQCISTWKFSQLTLNLGVMEEAFLTVPLTSCWPGAEHLMLSWEWLMGSICTHWWGSVCTHWWGSVYTHWWAPSVHTDGFHLHTLMGSVCTHWWVLSTLMGSVYTHWWVPSTHTLMGSVCTHWWVLSTHTDGFCLHTLMPTSSTGRESVALKLPLNSFIHNLKRSRTRLISPSPSAASLLGQICQTAFIQNFK